MACSMFMAAVSLMACTVVQADQCSSGGECKSSNEPQRFVSLLQTNLRMNVLEESVEYARGGKKDAAPKAKAAAKKEGSPKAKPKAEPKKEVAKGKAKAMPKEDKVELAEGSVLDEQSQWISCAFDWNTLSHAHVASDQWHFIDGLGSKLQNQRTLIGKQFKPISSSAQSTVPDRLEPLLTIAASMLDQLEVNWYLAFGAELGYLRSEALIPWDEDVDIVVKTSDQIRVCDFIKEGAETVQGDGAELAVYRSVPEHPEWLMVGYYTGEQDCYKVLWVDVETEVAIDMCIDCHAHGEDELVPTKRALFGGVQVNVPENPFNSSIHNYDSVDNALEEITMKTSSGGGWSCSRYECSEEPPTGTSAVSLSDAYSTNHSMMRGPFDFHIDTSTSLHTTAQCSLPRKFESCSAVPVDLNEVWAQSCQSSPWASSASADLNLVYYGLDETKQVAEYQVGPWMVVKMQTQ